MLACPPKLPSVSASPPLDRMIEEDRTRRRLASALGSPLTSSAPSNWWNWRLTGGVDSVTDGAAPTDGPRGP